ncbi:MAG: hypothetical protein ACXVFN_22115 [Solirubrobacteraceae bacterium]
MRTRLALLVLCLSLAGAAVAPATQAAATRSCGSVKDPYPGTRYAGVDLTRITAKGVSCATAKRVAKGAHKKALGLTPPPGGIRSFAWDGWKVSGDLRGSHDTYVAAKGSKRVRWRF